MKRGCAIFTGLSLFATIIVIITIAGILGFTITYILPALIVFVSMLMGFKVGG